MQLFVGIPFSQYFLFEIITDTQTSFSPRNIIQAYTPTLNSHYLNIIQDYATSVILMYEHNVHLEILVRYFQPYILAHDYVPFYSHFNTIFVHLI
jgi:hypothetical protein